MQSEYHLKIVLSTLSNDITLNYTRDYPILYRESVSQHITKEFERVKRVWADKVLYGCFINTTISYLVRVNL